VNHAEQLNTIERHFPKPPDDTVKVEPQSDGTILVRLDDGSILAAHADGRGVWRYWPPRDDDTTVKKELFRDCEIVKAGRIPVLDVPAPPTHSNLN
jgi:hypothetical protein